MPRSARAVLPGHPLHLIQRGNNRSPCFVDDEDRERYKRALLESSERAGCAIHAYVLMSNHVHLLITPRDTGSPARMMQALGRRYVRYFNDRYARSGTLWEGRFRSTLVDSERYLLACSRYIETNPVRAGMVTRPERYAWSSHRCNAHGEADVLVANHRVYTALAQNATLRLASYRALFDSALDADMLDAIRRAANTGTPLGTGRHRVTAERALRRPLGRMAHGGDRRSEWFRRSEGRTE